MAESDDIVIELMAKVKHHIAVVPPEQIAILAAFAWTVVEPPYKIKPEVEARRSAGRMADQLMYALTTCPTWDLVKNPVTTFSGLMPSEYRLLAKRRAQVWSNATNLRDLPLARLAGMCSAIAYRVQHLGSSFLTDELMRVTGTVEKYASDHRGPVILTGTLYNPEKDVEFVPNILSVEDMLLEKARVDVRATRTVNF